MAALLRDDRLDEVFHALANRTRRALLARLASGPARVTELAGSFAISLAAVSKHLFVLERAGLVRREKAGHVQSCILDAGPLASAGDWIAAYRQFWHGNLDRLAVFVEREED